MYICVICDPPATSSYTLGLDYDILERLGKEMTLYNKLGEVFLCGDLNAKVSNCNNFTANNDMYLPIYDQYSITKQIRNRECQDGKIDSKGKNL